MPDGATRKPLQPAGPQSRAPRSVRASDAEWQPFEIAGRSRDMEASTLFRECAFIGLMVLETPALMEAYARTVTALRQTSGA